MSWPEPKIWASLWPVTMASPTAQRSERLVPSSAWVALAHALAFAKMHHVAKRLQYAKSLPAAPCQVTPTQGAETTYTSELFAATTASIYPCWRIGTWYVDTCTRTFLDLDWAKDVCIFACIHDTLWDETARFDALARRSLRACRRRPA